jgi:elongation factor P
MAMLEYSEIKERKYIIFDNEPYEVLSSHVFRKQMRKPVNATKLRNLISGRVIEHSFGATDKADEAEIEYKNVKYLYNNRGEWWFCAENNPADRFKLGDDILGDKKKFLKPNMIVEGEVFDEKIFRINLPVKVELKVTEAPPAVKGDTAKGGNKQVTLETGAVVNAPLFISEGDVIRINVETGEYVERVNS